MRRDSDILAFIFKMQQPKASIKNLHGKTMIEIFLLAFRISLSHFQNTKKTIPLWSL
jgi:hypothetical protein